jgi:hypothetical protein
MASRGGYPSLQIRPRILRLLRLEAILHNHATQTFHEICALRRTVAGEQQKR